MGELGSPTAVFTVLAGLALPIETAAAAPIRMGAIGDAVTDEYTTSEAPLGQSWVDILATRRNNEIDFGTHGNWGEPRRRGYEFNWARYGATSADMVRTGQHTGLASQAVDFAFVGIGTNDFSPWAGSYSSIYNGRDDGSQTTDSILENLSMALNQVAGTPDNPTGVKVVIGNIGELGAIPFVRSNYPNAEKRDLVSTAEMAANDRIAELAAERGMPVVDVFGLLDLVNADTPTTVGDVTIRNGYSSNPQYFFLDHAHPGTVWQGLLANAILDATNQAYAAGFTKLSDQEILDIARIDDPNSGSVTCYFPIEDFVSFVPKTPKPGDFDGDGARDLADVDLLSRQIANNIFDASFDLTSDYMVNRDDLDRFLELAGKLNGDADFDGSVQFADLVILANNFGMTEKVWSQGDFDANGEVQFPDLVILADNFGQGASVDQGAQLAANVPEPSATLLGLIAAVALLAWNRSARPA